MVISFRRERQQFGVELAAQAATIGLHPQPEKRELFDRERSESIIRYRRKPATARGECWSSSFSLRWSSSFSLRWSSSFSLPKKRNRLHPPVNIDAKPKTRPVGSSSEVETQRQSGQNRHRLGQRSVFIRVFGENFRRFVGFGVWHDRQAVLFAEPASQVDLSAAGRAERHRLAFQRIERAITRRAFARFCGTHGIRLWFLKLACLAGLSGLRQQAGVSIEVAMGASFA
jgi:hypothetical protein